MRFLYSLLLCALPLAANPPLPADDAPAWLRQAATSTVTTKYDAKVKAVTLHDESRVDVEEGGKITTTTFYALKILTKEGRASAIGDVMYETGAGKIKEMRAWIIRPSGEVKKFGKERVFDVMIDENDVYNEGRAQIVDASKDIDPGDVFGYEWVKEEKTVFMQFLWAFQGAHPSLSSSFTINVPAGWRANGVTFNHAKIEPTVSGNSYTWQMQDLGPVEREPSSPRLSSIVPRLAVNLMPPAGARTGLGKSFENWQDVARWNAEISDPQAVASPELTAKTQSLVAAAKTDFERIQAIGRYVQGVKYVSIQTGLGRGGGYKPHTAAEVFAKSYGDCKDKANLMRTMLKVAGIEAYSLAIYSGDPMFVREEWVSPQQFNHAIVAIKLKDDLKLGAVRWYPNLGRMLFFDPTDEHTPVGMIPEDEENSWALLISSDQGGLLRMPTSAPETNRLERHVELTLESDGSVAGKVEENAFGHPAESYRHERDHMEKGEFRKRMESWISESGSGAAMKSLDVADGANEAMKLEVGFAIPRYAKLMQGVLLVVKPSVLPPRERVYLAETTRKYPIVLNAESFDETMRMKLPAGFDVDELPRPFQTKTDFGSFSSSSEVKDGILTYHRSLTVNAGVIPVERYKEARTFFSAAYGSGEQPVVLAKK
jgi:hypothetical protein